MFATFTDAENTNLVNVFYGSIPAFTSFPEGKHVSKLEIKKIPSHSLTGWPLPARTRACIPTLPPWSGTWGDEGRRAALSLAAIQRFSEEFFNSLAEEKESVAVGQSVSF